MNGHNLASVCCWHLITFTRLIVKATPTFQPEFDLLLIFDRIHRVGSSSARQTTSVTHELSARTTTRQKTEAKSGNFPRKWIRRGGWSRLPAWGWTEFVAQAAQGLSGGHLSRICDKTQRAASYEQVRTERGGGCASLWGGGEVERRTPGRPLCPPGLGGGGGVADASESVHLSNHHLHLVCFPAATTNAAADALNAEALLSRGAIQRLLQRFVTLFRCQAHRH